MAALWSIERAEYGSQDAIRYELSREPLLAERDGRLLTELVYGSLRRQRSLDRWLDKACARGLASVDGPALVALRVGCYQLAELSKIPDYAAIDATTSAAASFVGKQKGFVHGVLRQLARTTPWKNAPRDDVPAWIRRRIDALADVTGYPREEMQAAFSTSAPLHLHALDDAAVDALHKAGVDVEPIAGLARVFRAQGGGFFQSAPFKARRVIAQDAASVAVGRWLGAEADDLVADVCAGRGGKSWSLASTGAEVTAFDLSADKLAAARQLVARSGNKLMATIVADLGPRGDPNSLDALAESFDKVLVDAPCTGLGTLRRRPEIRHRRRAADVCANASLQRAILDRAAALVRPGGILLYAVCSMTDEEGGSTVQRFLEKHPDFARAPTDGAWIADALDSHGDLRSHPMWHGSDAFYAARLRRND